MAIGTYETAPPNPYNSINGLGPGRTGAAIRVTYNQDVVLKSFFEYIYAIQQATSTTFIVHRVSDAAQVYSQTFTPSNTTGAYQEFALTSTLVLAANVQYSFGFYYSTSLGYTYCSTSTTAGVSGTSTPTAPFTSTWVPRAYTSTSGTAMPTTAGTGSLIMKLSVSQNTLPSAPTNLVVTNNPVPANSAANLTWTHNDAEGDVQSKYQIRWRKV